MTYSCDFKANPQGVVSGGSVRFYPWVVDAAAPIVNYHWDFGDGTAHVDGPNPAHAFPTVATRTSYSVTLTVTDANSDTATITKSNFIWSDAAANIPDPYVSNDVAVFLYDGVNSMILRRHMINGAHALLLTPRTVDRIDTIGTATFSILDLGTTTATERGLMEEGNSVAIVCNRAIVFSGVVRRCVKDTQNCFTTSAGVQKYNLECASDLERHVKIAIDAAALKSGGLPYFDSPGNIARAILDPGSGTDRRGIIDCTDSSVFYQLNSADAEDVGNQYDHLKTLLDATNYDLRARPFGQMHTLAEGYTWSYLPPNGNFELGELYESWWDPYTYANGYGTGTVSTYADVDVSAAAKRTGNYGSRFRIRLRGLEEAFSSLYGYADITHDVYPSGYTGISFDYKIVAVGFTPTIVNPADDWGDEGDLYASFSLWNGSSYLWYAPQMAVGEWQHVDVTTSSLSMINFTLEVDYHVETLNTDDYYFEVYLDNVVLNYPTTKTSASIRTGRMWVDGSLWPVVVTLSDGTLVRLNTDSNGTPLHNQVWVSYDSGATWALINDNLNFSIYSATVLPGDTILAFGIYGDDALSTSFAVSTDMGVTWTVTKSNTGYTAGSQWSSLACDPSGNAYFIYDGSLSVYKSVDGGYTWTAACASPGWDDCKWRKLLGLSDGYILAFGEMHGVTEHSDVWRSTNGGTTWTRLTTDLGVSDCHVQMVQMSDGHLIALIEDTLNGEYKFYESTDGGTNWTLISSNTFGDLWATMVLGDDDAIIVLCPDMGSVRPPVIRVSTDGASSFSIVNGYEPSSLEGTTVFFDNGVSGTVSSNSVNVIAVDEMAGADTIDSGGQAITPAGYYIDFARDLSQPSVVKNLDVNKDCFNYNDNDDKQKLSTKVVARAKDYQGKSISVMLAAVHEYDVNRLFFEYSTFLTKKCEGEVYKNNWADPVTPRSVSVWKNSYPSTYYEVTGDTDTVALYGASGDFDHEYFCVGSYVFFSKNGDNPPNLSNSPGRYFVYSHDESNGEWIALKAARTDTSGIAHGDTTGSLPGTQVYVGSKDGGFCIDNNDGYLNKDDAFTITADTFPSNCDGSTTYYVLDQPGSTTEEGFRFSTSVDGTPVQITSAGSNVQINRITNVSAGGIDDTDPTIWLYGWGYTMPTGTTIGLSRPGVSCTQYTTTGAPTEGVDNGIPYTAITLTTWMEEDFSSGKGYCLAKRLYVDDYSQVGSNEVLIGEEKVTVSSTGTDTTNGQYIEFADVTDRVSSSTLKCYPHGVGALVSRTNHTEASPDANSPIALYGPVILDRTVDGSNISYGQLDAYAAKLLLGLGNFYKKATCWVPLHKAWVKRVSTDSDFPSYSTPIEVGDRISTTEYDGATPEEFEVVAVTTEFDNGRMILELGDYEKNIFSSLEGKTNAVDRTLT